MERERIRRRDLPHWDMPGAAYFITSCLEGSIPAQGLLQLAEYRAELRRRPRPQVMSDREWEIRRWKLGFVRLEQWLDLHSANRLLERPELAQIVENAMFHFAEERLRPVGLRGHAQPFPLGFPTAIRVDRSQDRERSECPRSHHVQPETLHREPVQLSVAATRDLLAS